MRSHRSVASVSGVERDRPRGQLRSSNGATSTLSMTERQLVEAGCRGDEDAFRGLIEPHRSPLHAHCYRMLGSRHDAEDALQDALLHAWRGLCSFQGRSALRPWLYRLTTNACLDIIARRPKPNSVSLVAHPDEVLDSEDGNTPEAHYERREAAELVFLTALRYLPPRQCAVLILRDVLNLPATEVADSLATSVASVNSALQRARKGARARLAQKSQLSTLRSLDNEWVEERARRLIDALDSGDVEAIVRLFAEDARVAPPSSPRAYRSPDPIAQSWLKRGGRLPRLRSIPTFAAGT
jgi:RNA polymerase sigma-70 factor (ECF subfamily)